MALDTLQLGQQVPLPAAPGDAVLDTVAAPKANIQSQMNVMDRVLASPSYFVRFSCPEFTSLCPVTGQPDFAHLVIDYMPTDVLVESKSLKLFLGSFRNHRDFHEACTDYIGMRLVTATLPHWLRVAAFWYPRGGIPIDVFWQYGRLPEGLAPPTIDVPSYRGR